MPKSLEGLFAELEAQIKLYGGSTNFIDHESRLHNSKFKKPHKNTLDLSDPNYGKYRYDQALSQYQPKPKADS